MKTTPFSMARLQRGTVLTMTLILLVIVSIVAAFTLRNSISGEQVSKNLATQSVALQNAELALRLCEDAIRKSASTIKTNAFVKLKMPSDLTSGSTPVQWETRANWSDAARVTTIPSTLVVKSGMLAAPSPKCMVEEYRLPRLDPDATLSDPYLVTAVGYSQDYRADANGNAISGGQAWVQSVLRP